MELDQILEQVRQRVEREFEESECVLSFEEFLEHFAAHPYRHLRSAPQYLLEMFEHFGQESSSRVGQDALRYLLFDLEEDEKNRSLIGQESVQAEVFQYIQSFAKRGKSDKMLLLHGPNGSGKTTVIENIVRGLEDFSRTPEGTLMTISWIFTERDGRVEPIGFEAHASEEEEVSSYAHLDAKEISGRFACELKCSPLFLLPLEHRRQLVSDVLGRTSGDPHQSLNIERFLEGELCQKCRKILDSLLLAYRGRLDRVLHHVRVERFYISKRYRSCAVSIEPQGNVDAAAQPITSEHSWSVPSVLRNVSLFQPIGDIVDANRGVLEYSDFLKRPLELNKYLLTTCERGTASLNNCMLYLDLTIFGTANEKQLSLFKRSPDFSSFKGRMELIPVPYLLRWSTEAELYRRQIRLVAKGRPILPHTAKVAALWAVLTRLNRPQAENYDEPLASIVPTLTPLEKAKLYDSGEVPDRLPEDSRKALRSGLLEIRDEFREYEGEFEGIFGSEYEGRRGVSPREVLTVLSRAAESRRYTCLAPMAVFEAIDELIRDVSLYDFLRLPADEGYHDVRQLLEDAQTEYLTWVTAEVYDSIDLIDESEYDRIFLEYFRQVKAFDTGEKVFNAATNSYDAPSETALERIEGLLELEESSAEFRSNIMTRIAAWSLDHRNQQIDYQAVFPEIYRALRENFYRERRRILTLIEQDILKYGTDEFELLNETEQEQVRAALSNMKEKYGYTEDGARDVIAFVLKQVEKSEE